jgi:hypothetical protein
MTRVSNELQRAIAAWLEHAKSSDLSRVSADGTAVRIYADAGGAIFIRPDGSMVGEAESGHEEPVDPDWRTSALVSGILEHPELRELLPKRPATGVSCTICSGTGRLTGAICGRCHGLGWITAA